MGFRRGYWTLLVVSLAAVSCGPAARRLDWSVSFEGGADPDAARVLTASILQGGCSGTSIYEQTFRIDDPSTAMTPPELEPGTYGFRVVAIDASCTPYAEGCQEIELPVDDGGAVEVALGPQAGAARCAPAQCDDGSCGGDMDAGRPDGGGRDAGPRDGGGVDAGFECPTGFADCNFQPGDRCEAELDTLDHCGGCNMQCRLPHAAEACAAGACTITGCDTDWEDCDSAAANGCETSTVTLTDCGGCGVACDLPHAVEQCNAGACELVSCLPGWADCDSTASNGCETSLETATDCGGCGMACGSTTPLCAVTPGGASCVALCPVDAPTACGSVCVATATDAQNCGGCGTVCAPANGAGVCTAGTCALGACDPSWGNCDGAAANGCERSLTTTTDCGGCGSACASATGVLSCATGTCAVDECLDGRGDCDSNATNGCEADLYSSAHCGACNSACVGATPSCGTSGGTVGCLSSCEAPASTACAGRCLDTSADRENCGACDNACSLPNATPVCLDSVCRVARCGDGFGDCDADPTNGCESTLGSDAAHCGGCGNACPVPANSVATCSAGTCGSRCMAGFGDCDGMASNGCEQPLDTLAHCGACGRSCGPPNATGSCATGTCRVGTCNTGFGDCDMSPTNGCEVDLNTDRSDCGTCGNRCAGGATRDCCSGVCGTC